MHPKITVAIPAYKSTFLRQAIDSVLGQTFADWELIIVNDASPEPVSEIVRDYDDPRIRYYANEHNIGIDDPALTWNLCLDYAEGDFFALLCDDDLYECTFLEQMYSLTCKYPAVSVFRSRVKVIDENNRVLDYYPSAPEWESCMDYLWHRVSGVRRQSISEFLIRRKYACSLGGYSLLPKAWFADEISVYRFSQENGIVSVNLPLSFFRISSQNISSNNSRNIRQKVEACNIYDKWISGFVALENEEYKRIVLQKLVSRNRINMTKYLTNASWRDFIFLCRHCKSERYHIYVRCFFKAIVARVAEILKNFLG